MIHAEGHPKIKKQDSLALLSKDVRFPNSKVISLYTEGRSSTTSVVVPPISLHESLHECIIHRPANSFTSSTSKIPS